MRSGLQSELQWVNTYLSFFITQQLELSEELSSSAKRGWQDPALGMAAVSQELTVAALGNVFLLIAYL